MDEQLERFQQLTNEALAEIDARGPLRKASEVIEHDTTLRPFSARLTAREIVRLRANARAEGVTGSDLLRRLLNDGLDRLEAKRTNHVDPQRVAEILDKMADLLELAEIPRQPRMAKKKQEAEPA